ncbi:glycerate kinase [Liquorilactobacillus satsumensis]|uniref:Glycerate kinase n=1 Tax=Liquorilactobacillus satsumensis DSM 16230 = JCM 12392 TaxID=1423801 RepID=A0A0R1UY97_9LACO|nr:glycerate kinase [Liquorilactobacillus satsumensis]KRL97716.1 glycerate kinase [Liquorilactobacillus satsumensis DSM 16230 = JCM 12392]MCC7666520.1 glycerate kinase [Liquorilactobacillus satsumensis]MCP9312931.1 glycerate kinase [Liquorilactobacillus satsumensis]MCP9329658.1 glycerate kinase [Liquorilactobacillus satsumensis]MCP9357514.1 glycerate kinase [Liquorilactobacillus satsumensis]
MKFVIAPDSFKGSLTAKEVADAIQNGIQKVFPTANFVKVPMADGGEGTVQSLVDASQGTLITKKVTGPLGKQVNATYGLLGDGNTAVIEMAEASGIGYVTEQTRDPLRATTFGTGELILDALDHQVSKIILGIGGSATNDGGAGMAQALGIKLLDVNGQPLQFGGGALQKLHTIDLSQRDPRIAATNILIASDVVNPLVGPQGASAVFGPQKGATPAMVAQLDHNLAHYARIVQEATGKDLAAFPGAGAAGGLGAGLLAFTNAKLKKGIEIVVDYTHLKEKAVDADFVFTGEGGIDFQTQYGKTPFGVALATRTVAPNAPVIALAGNVGEKVDVLYQKGIFTAIFATVSGAKSLSAAFADGRADIAQTAENIARLIKATH